MHILHLLNVFPTFSYKLNIHSIGAFVTATDLISQLFSLEVVHVSLFLVSSSNC